MAEIEVANEFRSNKKFIGAMVYGRRAKRSRNAGALILEERVEDKDYVNNYENPAGGGFLEDKDRNGELLDSIRRSLWISCIVFAVIFTVIYPTFAFCSYFCRDCKMNTCICLDVCCCQNPRYRVVRKEALLVHGRRLPKYREYQRLMKLYDDEQKFEHIKVLVQSHEATKTQQAADKKKKRRRHRKRRH